MVRHGYVERRVDPERRTRSRPLVLAARGQQALRSARAFHQTFEEHRSSPERNGADRAQALREALEALISAGDDVSPRDTAPHRVLRAHCSQGPQGGGPKRG